MMQFAAAVIRQLLCWEINRGQCKKKTQPAHKSIKSKAEGRGRRADPAQMKQHFSILRPHSTLTATSLIWSSSLRTGAAAPDLGDQQQGESSCKGAYGKAELIHRRQTILRR